ncbi:myb-like protein X, partial [Diaphorina citri]|uniref:Myb-like protein X n=1 Tax=Diaphorina citri TaxID=121845 RepID=A0A1S3DQD7_DIACI
NKRLRDQEEQEKKLLEEKAKREKEEQKDLEKRRQLDFIERERKENELLNAQAKEIQFPDVTDVDVQTVPSDKEHTMVQTLPSTEDTMIQTVISTTEDTMIQKIPSTTEDTMVQTIPFHLKQTQTSFSSTEKDEVQNTFAQTKDGVEGSAKPQKEAQQKGKKLPKPSKEKSSDVKKPGIIVKTEIHEEKVVPEKEPKQKKGLQRSEHIEETSTVEKVTQVPSTDDKSSGPSDGQIKITLQETHIIPVTDDQESKSLRDEKNNVTPGKVSSKISEKDTPSKDKSKKKKVIDQSTSPEQKGDSKSKQKPHLLGRVSKFFSKKKTKESSTSPDEETSQDDSVQTDTSESEQIDVSLSIEETGSSSTESHPVDVIVKDISLQVYPEDSEGTQTSFTKVEEDVTTKIEE